MGNGTESFMARRQMLPIHNVVNSYLSLPNHEKNVEALIYIVFWEASTQVVW